MPAPWDGRLTTYLGSGLAAARPATPNTAPGLVALWYSTDTDVLSIWVAGAWSDVVDTAATISDLIDAQIGSTEGAILFRDAAGWAIRAPGLAGQVLYTPTDGADPVWASPGGGGGGSNWWYDPPLAADFTLTSGDATNLTLTDDADEGLLFDPGAPVATNLNRAALITLTDKTLDWDLVVRMSAVLPTNYVTAYGPCIYDSISGRLTCLEMTSNSNWNAINSTTLASGATRTNALTSEAAPFRTIGPYWMRITHVGTSYNFYRSVNGKNWQLHGTVTDTSFLTNRGDKVGFTVMTATAGGTDKRCMGNITHWSLTGPGV